MAMAPTVKVVLGSIAYAIFWVLAVFPAVPFLPVGRTAGSLLGAMLMVIFRVISPDQAYAAIDLPVLGLLFGTMVVSVYLERADMFKYLGRVLSWKSMGGKDLLCRTCLISAISSALFTNDTSCVVLTEFVLKIARQNNLPPQPFLLALASSANIGSSATPIGNPQNLVIAVKSKISFGKFLVGILPAMLIGVVMNVVLLLCFFWRVLSIEKDEEFTLNDAIAEDNVTFHRFSPATMSHVTSMNSREWGALVSSLSANVNSGLVETLRNRFNQSKNDMWRASSSGIESDRSLNVSKDETGGAGFSQTREDGDSSRRIPNSGLGSSPTNGQSDVASFESASEKERRIERWKQLFWKTSVYLITIGMLISFLMGLNMSWTAITAALALVVLDFKDAQPCLEKETGIPKTVWDAMEPYARIDHAGGIALLALVILVLSNIASNVPTVLLLGARVAASAAAISAADEKKAWLILAWVSTVAGNLSLLGSAANLIVCEQARRAQSLSYTLSFWSHLKFGVPSTLIVIAIGLPLIRG